MTAGGAISAQRVWRRVKWTRAGQLAPQLDGMANLEGLSDVAPVLAFARLREVDRVQATHFMAQCLPRMDAIQWMATCLRRNGKPKDPVRAEAAVAVHGWIANPSDPGRRHAYLVGSRAGWDCAEGAACLAVFLAGGSMAPAEQEIPVNPPPGAFGRVAAASILISAHAHGPAAFERNLDEMLEYGDAAAAGELGGDGRQ